MAYNPPPASLNRLGAIVQKIAQATPIQKQFVKPPKILAKLAGGKFISIRRWSLTPMDGSTGRGKVIHPGNRRQAYDTRTTFRSTRMRCHTLYCHCPIPGSRVSRVRAGRLCGGHFQGRPRFCSFCRSWTKQENRRGVDRASAAARRRADQGQWKGEKCRDGSSGHYHSFSRFRPGGASQGRSHLACGHHSRNAAVI